MIMAKKKPAKKPMHLFTGIVFCSCDNKMYIPSGGTKYACTKCKDKFIAERPEEEEDLEVEVDVEDEDERPQKKTKIGGKKTGRYSLRQR